MQINLPQDQKLERAFLYGFLAGVPSPYLPPEAVLDYFEGTGPEIKKAFESGQNLADQSIQWCFDIQAGYFEDKAVYGERLDNARDIITRALACSDRATKKMLRKKKAT